MGYLKLRSDKKEKIKIKKGIYRVPFLILEIDSGQIFSFLRIKFTKEILNHIHEIEEFQFVFDQEGKCLSGNYIKKGVKK